MEKLSQQQAPIYEALEELRKMRVVPFDVPGHKRGRGNPELTRLLGERCMNMDVNSMKPLDNLCHPVSVIAQAEQLAAEAFSCSSCLFNGGRHNLFGTEHDFICGETGRKDYFAKECTPQCDWSHGAMRGCSCLCESPV